MTSHQGISVSRENLHAAKSYGTTFFIQFLRIKYKQNFDYHGVSKRFENITVSFH